MCWDLCPVYFLCDLYIFHLSMGNIFLFLRQPSQLLLLSQLYLRVFEQANNLMLIAQVLTHKTRISTVNVVAY